MKKLLSVIVLVCILASMCTVSAWADAKVSTYEGLANALSAGGNITLENNITVPGGSSLTVSSNTILNLGEYTISGVDTGTVSAALINIQPGVTLTVNGPGKISYSATQNRGWNAYSSTISNQRGILNISGATIEHLGGTDMSYAIDNLTNGAGTAASTTIYSGYISSTYIGIRQFANGHNGASNKVTVNGGTIYGGSRGIWMQDSNTSANNAQLDVKGGSVNKVDVYATPDDYGVSQWNFNVNIAGNTVSSIVARNVPAEQILANINGTYKLYYDIQEAFNAAGTDGSIGLVHNVALPANVNVPAGITVNLNGNSLTGGGLVAPNGGSVTVTDSVGGGSVNVNGNNVTGGNVVNVGTDGTSTVAPIPTPADPAAPAAPAAPAVQNVYYIPATSDNSNMALWSILALALLTTAFVTRKKKAEN